MATQEQLPLKSGDAKPDQHRSETVVIDGVEPLKALGVDESNPQLARVGAYAVRFSGPDEKDLSGEYFTKSTYFGSKNGDGADILFNHGEPIGKSNALKSIAEMTFGVAKAMKDDIGVFIETVLDLADEYQKAIFDLIQQGKLAWSTGSASHVVKKAPDGQIKRWPIIESSFTPMPCEPRLPKITELKSVKVDENIREEIKAAFTQPNPPVDTSKETKAKAEHSPQPPEQQMSEENKNEKPQPKIDVAAETKKVREQELSRQREIKAIGKGYKNADEIVEKAIEDGTSLEDFNKFVVPVLKKFNADKPIVAAPADKPSIEVVGEREARKSIGEMFTGNDAYKRAAKTMSRTDIATLEFDLPNTKATLLTSTGPFTSYDRPPGIVMVEQQRLYVRDLLAQGTTTAPTIRYMKETSFTNAADVVAEEGLKPDASWDLEEDDSAVTKIAVIGRVSQEVFSDFPSLQSYVDQRLRFMVKAKEEQQLLNGTGSSNQLTGILQTSGIQTQAVAGSDDFAGIMNAITKVRSTGFFEPDGIVLHPTDYQTLRLSKDGNGQYYGGGPFMGSYGNGGVQFQPPVWGLNPVVTTAITQGTALVGAFKLGAQIFDRLGLTVATTDTDGSDWSYNRVAIRVEERLALAVYRPLAFCKITGL